MAGYVQDHTEAQKQVAEFKQSFGELWDTNAAFMDHYKIGRESYHMKPREALERATIQTKNELHDNWSAKMESQTQEQSQGQRIG